MSFSHDDVQRLIKLLDSSHFDELHLEAEGIKLTLRRNGAALSSAPAPAGSPFAAAAPTIASTVAPTVAPSAASAVAPQAASSARASVVAPGAPVATALPASDPTLLDIRAPMLGTFYGAPKPGAGPFVALGERIGAATAVGIIEVMKLMNSVSAGVEGVLVEVLVRDGDLVEFEQVLMRVRPA
jgi:acetyl-CoA carboxylase biotin carboxyl carrier protein